MERSLFLEPSLNDWESKAVFNPTAIKEDEDTHVIYRAVGIRTPSCFGYAKINGGKVYRSEKPLMVPTENEEKMGIEDPRITKMADGKYHLMYTAYDGTNARIAHAEGDSINSLRKYGIVSPNITVERAIELVDDERCKKIWRRYTIHGKSSILWDKDAVLFPEKIAGKFVMLHRIEPDIHFVRFNSFEDIQKASFWEGYIENIKDHVLMKPMYGWESEKIGAGATPIKTPHGWLLLYHGVEKNCHGYVYSAGAALISEDLKKQTRLKEPLFRPEEEWEKFGCVNYVVFPTGMTVDDSTIDIFYGGADRVIGRARCVLEDLLEELLRQ